MIFTVTLNPALDYYLNFDHFKEGELNTPKETYQLPGGKGINISKLLHNYNTPNIALGFLGGYTGEFIESALSLEGISSHFIKIDDNTRTNIKINNNGIESEIAGTSPIIKESHLNSFFKYLKENLKSGDIIALSGSVPKSLPKNIYSKIINILPDGVRVILDTRGETLKEALNNKVFLIKPNKDEINEFFKSNFSTHEELIIAGKKLQSLGAENVIISLGSKGSIFLTEKEVFIGDVPKGKLVSSNGAGDSMLGGFIYGLYNNLPLEKCYKFAIASGSGTAFSKGVSTFETAKKLLNEIKIEKL